MTLKRFFLIAAAIFCFLFAAGCGETAEHDHVFVTESVIEPGCETYGSEKRVCSICGEAEEVSLDPVGHRVDDPQKELVRSGDEYVYTERGHCRVCGKDGAVFKESLISYGISESGSVAESPDIPLHGGRISANLYGDELNIAAAEDDYYVFIGWSDGNTEAIRKYSGDKPVCALFGYKSYAMPVVSITTDGGEPVLFRDHYIKCEVSVSNCPEKFGIKNAAASIRVRGNASSNYGDPEYARTHKVHYRLKFDKKTSFLGLNDNAECKSWVLLRGDTSFLNEPLSFKLFNDITKGGYYASDYTYIQVYLNYEYHGAYILCEQTQIQKNRISIHEKDDGDTELFTGYLLEIDNYPASEPYVFATDFGGFYITDVYGVSKRPRGVNYSVKYDDLTARQLEFVKNYVESVYRIVYIAIYQDRFYKLDENMDLIPAPEFKSAEECIGNVLDIDAAAAMYITREVAAERDGGIGSFFMYVDFLAEKPLLTFCAPWDFSWAYSESDGFRIDRFWVSGFQPPEFARFGDRSFTWFITLYGSDFFKEKVKTIWRDMSERGVQEGILAEIDRVKTEYADDFDLNDSRWDSGSQSERADQIKDFLYERMKWLDTQWK